jgi:GT2 family glycosyltransferase
MTLGVVYVTHNSAEWLAKSIETLRESAATIADLNIVVVDNDSSDQTASVARRADPSAVVLPLKENVGFSKAVNIGFKHSSSTADVLLLNPDTILLPSTIPTVLAAVDDRPGVGLAGCRLVRLDGSLDPACKRQLPRLASSMFAISPLARLPWLRRLDRYRQARISPDDVAIVEAISGAFMLIRGEARARIGPFDEDFFLYGEDLDYCLRAARAGYSVLYVGTAAAVHIKYGSVRRSNYRAVERRILPFA